MQEVVVAPDPDFLTQVFAIVYGTFAPGFLGVFPPGINSKLVNRLFSISWLGGFKPLMKGWSR